MELQVIGDLKPKSPRSRTSGHPEDRLAADGADHSLLLLRAV